VVNGVWLQSLKEGMPKPPLSGEEFGNVLDFFGLNYFSGNVCYFEESYPTPPWYYFQARVKEYCEKDYMGWWVYPEGIHKVLRRVHKIFGLPIMVTSNGIGTNDDLQRRRFMVNHLRQIRRAMDEGADVIGYMYWSFMDNFEWAMGFEPKFGLEEIDYKALERIPRKSAYLYGEIAKKNGIDSEMEEKYLK
jgi:beta-glucosidase